MPTHGQDLNQNLPIERRPPASGSNGATNAVRPVAAPLRAPLRGSASGFMTAGRSPGEFARAATHSARVRFLKRALPIGGSLAIAVLVAAYLMSQFSLPRIDPGEAAVVDGKLVMNNPKLAGTDPNQRPYTLSAERAVQDAAKPTRVTLEKIEGRLAVSDTNFAKVGAGTGVYDTEARTLELSGQVRVDTDDGMSIRLENAAIDIDKGTLVSNSPVTVDTGRARVSAQSLKVSNKGKSIVFENKVRMLLQPIDPAAAKPMPAASNGVAQ